MENSLLIGFLFMLGGTFLLIFSKSIIKVQGASKKDDFPIETRKKRLIFAGIGLLIGGILLILKII